MSTAKQTKALAEKQYQILQDIRLWAYRGKQADAGAGERRKILRHIEKLAKSTTCRVQADVYFLRIKLFTECVPFLSYFSVR